MVDGLDRLHARFGRLAPAIKAELVRTLEAQAEKIVKDMRNLVPVETGALRRSINWTWGDAPAGSVSVGQVKGAAYDRIAITIYAGTRDKSLGAGDAFYARFQEFGTRKMAANPFFFPAYRANRTAVRSAITRAVRKAAKTV
jgi:HK97 gp10 family phage protein